jgi:hypothetical protein
MGTHLVHEHQAFWIDTTHLHAPEGSQKLVPFCCPCGPFFGSCALAPPPDKRSLRSPKPPERIQELGSLGVSSPRPALEVF